MLGADAAANTLPWAQGEVAPTIVRRRQLSSWRATPSGIGFWGSDRWPFSCAKRTDVPPSIRRALVLPINALDVMHHPHLSQSSLSSKNRHQWTWQRAPR